MAKTDQGLRSPSRLREWLCSFAVLHPVWTILLTVSFVLLTSAGAKNLVFKSDYRVFFSKENPQLSAYEAMQKIYNKSDNVALILSPKNGNVFTRENLEAVRWLTEAAWQVPFSTRVDSLSNYQHTHAEGDDLVVEDLAFEPLQLSDADLQRIRQVALSEPLLLHKLISPGGEVTVVNITVQLPGINTVKEVPEVITKVREIKGQFIEKFPDIELRLSGMVVMNNTFAESSLEDNATLVPLMFAVVILTITFLLKTFTGTLSTVLVIAFSISATMGLAGWTGFYLTGPSAGTPIMILTLAVADCVHILSTQFYEMRHGVEKRKAIIDSLRINLQPIFLTSATTAIGFLSMNFSDSPPFRDLGNMVAVGVVLAFLFSISLFPALLSLLPLHVKPHGKGFHDPMINLADKVIRHHRGLLVGTSILMALMAALAPLNVTNDDFVKYFDRSVPFRQATDYMQEHLTGMTTIEISIDSGRSSGVNDPGFLQMLGNFSDWLRNLPETDHVNTITDTIKRLNRNMHGDDTDWYRLPDAQDLSAQYLLLYEMSLPYGLDLNNQLNVDKSSTRIVGTFKNMTSNEQITLENQILDWFKDNAPQYTVQTASPALMFAHIGQRNIHSMLTGITFALVLISALLGLALRSLKFGLISLLPNLAPAAIGFGLWYLIDGQVGLALSVVAGMTLGIIVDDTVHFLSKYLHARRDRDLDSLDSVRYAFSSVGRALWITTFVLFFGFMVLAQSTFKVNADMGLLTGLTILIALAVDFLFLPPLLILLDRKKTS